MLGGFALLGSIFLGLGAVAVNSVASSDQRRLDEIGRQYQATVGKRDPELGTIVLHIPLYNACGHTLWDVKQKNDPCSYNRANYLWASEHLKEIGYEFNALQLQEITGYAYEIAQKSGTYDFLKKR